MSIWKIDLYLKVQTLVVLAALLATLTLISGCTSDETAAAAPGAIGQSAAAVPAEPQEPPPTVAVKSSSRHERALAPTPTLHPEATALQVPTATALNLDVVAYDQATSANDVAPLIEEAKETAVPPVACDARMAGSDLLALVTKEYGLSKDSAPDDLVPLADHVPYAVTVGYPTEVREVILQPLVEMIDAMLSEGLQPLVLSGYRSYAAQAISWNKWNRLYPERAAIISAQPGHSEHQLGTVIDFGSPELPGLVGQPGIQFHTYFYKTSEGQWLAQNAHKYGFTLSFTEEAFDTTGFYYEPWHFRYVGKAWAGKLHDLNLTLTEYQLANEPQPCSP